MAKQGLLGKIKNSLGGKKEAAPKRVRKPKKAAPKKAQEPKTPKVWPARRLNVVEKVWGEGYVTPGGAEQVRKLLPLLEVDKTKSVLVLGPALGGVHETIVEMTGAWITGLEGDHELAELGHASILRNPELKRQAPVKLADLEHLDLKPKSFDYALSFEGTLNVADKQALFAAVAESLRVHGELMFSTLALPDTGAPGPVVQAWIEAEPATAKPHPWPAQALAALLDSLNMEVRPIEDQTADYRRWVMQGFMKFLSTLSKNELKDISQELVTEVEYWTARINAIDAGELKAVRLHAIKLPEKRKSVDELMAAG